MKENTLKLTGASLGGLMIGAVMFTAISVSAHPGGDLTDEERETKRSEMIERKEAALADKVNEGTITQEQSDQIQTWFTEKTAEREANQADRLTKEDFQALNDEERSALKEEKQQLREERKAEAEEFFEGLEIEKEDLFGEEGFSKKGGRYR